MHLNRLAPVFLLSLAALLLTLGATALAQPIDQVESVRSPDDLWTFQGMVFDGNVGDVGDPIQSVTVELYGSNDYGLLGVPLDNTTTSESGWYGFEYQDRNGIYEYYNIKEIDPMNYASIGATTVSGTVMSKNWIQISAATTDRTFTGNRFWDRIPLLQGKVFEGPVPDESNPMEGVTVTLFCGLNQSEPGLPYAETTTDENGWYGLLADVGCDYYNIMEIDPYGHVSEGADSVSGTVMSPNWIQYEVPIFEKVWTGNKFWDQPEAGNGWLEGVVLDAYSSGAQPACTQASVFIDPGGLSIPTDPSTGDYGPVSLPPDTYNVTAEAPGYESMQVLNLDIYPNLTTVQDFQLERPVIMVQPPDFISITAVVSQEITYPLTITNAGSVDSKYELDNNSPTGSTSWFWVDPLTGTLPGNEKAFIDVTFHCTQTRDYEGVIQVFHQDPCLGPIEVPIILHCEEPPPVEWTKWVNDILWNLDQNPDLRVTAETSDTIKVVDEVRTDTMFDLVEKWNPERLKLLGWVLSPSIGELIEEDDKLTWKLLDPPPIVTMTKWFHVEPCTWLETFLEEEIWRGEQLLQHRPVQIEKMPPILEIDSEYDPQVFAGDIATFTLVYSNVGGYENNVVITNTFPPGAPFLRSQPPPDDQAADGSNASWVVGDLATDARGEIVVAVTINPGLDYSSTLPIWDGIFNHIGALADETFIEFHVNPPPQWKKWVNGLIWDPDVQYTVQTSDTIVVVDSIISGAPFDLEERWNTERLRLTDWNITPNVGERIDEDGRLIWHIPQPPDILTITKWFHVEPCTWTHTILTETIHSGGQVIENRPVKIFKMPPQLHIDSAYKREVYAGDVATFTLIYSNTGGYENNVVITNTFPPASPFLWSQPAPDFEAADGSVASWQVGDLATGDRDKIVVAVAVDPGADVSTTISIWDGIFNHLGILRDETTIELHVNEPPEVDWRKWIDLVPWDKELVFTRQTSDTIRVVDVITSDLIYELVESWNPEHLKLLDWSTTPPGIGIVITDVGQLSFVLSEPIPVVTVTKLFHVKPCNWEFTVLEERLYVEGEPEPIVRPAPIEKLLPDLWIEGEGPEGVISGAPAMFALKYGNDGGREIGAWIRNEFPPQALFVSSIPAPVAFDSEGAWAYWELPQLNTGQRGSISVTVDLAFQIRPSTTVTVWDGIFDHTRELVDETFIDLHVVPPPVTFPEGEWPWYAQGEISVHPYPAVAGRPTELCVELVNTTDVTQTAQVVFSWADFGIGLTWRPIGMPRTVMLPPHSLIRECIHWVPPVSGQICLQVELQVKDFPRQWSQRNMDVIEPLQLDTPHSFVFPVGNPLQEEVTITLRLIPHLPNWGLALSSDVLKNVQPGASRLVTLTVTPMVELPKDGAAVVDVEAFVEGQLIGGFRKIFRPPVILHRLPDPVYAESEITVEPYPPRAGEPVEVCVELKNTSDDPQDAAVQFSWAKFGIGLPWTPIDGLRVVHMPPHSIVKECIYWVPPVGGQVCLQVELFMDNYHPQKSQRNIDINEPLKPNTPHSLRFLVGNPLEEPVTVTMGLIPRLPGWQIEITPEVLANMRPNETRPVTLTVTPPTNLPPDETVIVDVEARAEGRLIGGFRKIFRPPVPVHRPRDPVYAESEIFINPYPPRGREPTELGVELRNISSQGYTATVSFSYADFGIGFLFQQIRNPIHVYVPAHSTVRPSIMWIPPAGGLWCIQVEVRVPGHEAVYRSRRNIDVDEPLKPLTPHSRIFRVRNPLGEAVTITLGLVPRLPGWGFELDPDTLVNVQPGETRPFTLTVTPPVKMPPDGAAIVDVEAYANGKLIGGIRKIYRPPVPVHKPKDPVYAESEIGVDPYPLVPGQPTKLSVEIHNPTPNDQVVTATFSIAPFGIGLPFDTSYITPNPIRIFVPAHGAASGRVFWNPPKWKGKFCVKVTLQMPGSGVEFWSQRNIDVGEPLRRGKPHSLVFPVGNTTGETITVSLGLIPHVVWDMSLSGDVVVVPPGETVDVTLTVTPTASAVLGAGNPIVDVEGFVDGILIGGFRKLDRPPIPIHKPHEKSYAETEILVDPYPPKKDIETSVGAVIQNTSDVTWTVDLDFGWAGFGMGIPFTTTGMTPPTRTVELGANMTTTAWVTWTPSIEGHQCLLVNLTDPSGEYIEQWSQRNVDVEPQPPCNQTKEFTFTVYNDSPFQVTVDIGMITFNVPSNWQVTVTPSPTLVLDAFTSGVVTVTVNIPCPNSSRALDILREIAAIQQESGSVPTLNVEGYVEGDLVGGIQLQFSGEEVEPVEAGFEASPTQGMAPMTVVFTNTSTGDYDTSLWVFGDGGTSSLENPTHIYTDGGVYTVTLTASGPGGSDVETRFSYIDVRFGVYLPLVLRE